EGTGVGADDRLGKTEGDARGAVQLELERREVLEGVPEPGNDGDVATARPTPCRDGSPDVCLGLSAVHAPGPFDGAVDQVRPPCRCRWPPGRLGPSRRSTIRRSTTWRCTTGERTAGGRAAR